MNLLYCVENIISKFENGSFFDSHTIIYELVSDKEFYQVYLDSFPKGCTIAQYHGQIAQLIEKSGLARKTLINGKEIQIKTHTIYGELGKNHLWEKTEKR